jgi:kynurenine formamidase
MSVVDLTHTLHPGIPTFDDGTCCAFRDLSTVAKGGYFNRELYLQEHAGTHIDAPSHFASNGWNVEEIPAERLMGPLVVLDVRKAVAQSATYSVNLTDVKQHEAKHGKIPPGAVVCALTGWSERWEDPVRYRNDFRFPGFALEAAECLVEERRVHGLGIDTLSIDVGTSKTFEVHSYALARKVFFLENLANLDKIAPRGHTCVVGAIKTRGGSGGPARVLAIKAAL